MQPTFLTTPLIAAQCGHTFSFLHASSTLRKTAARRTWSFCVIGWFICLRKRGRLSSGSSTREHVLQMHWSTATSGLK